MAVADLIAQTLAQHISNPRVISFAGTKLNEVQGRFIAANRVYNFVLDKKGVSYSPAGRNDSLVFSALFLERLDAVKRPKIGDRVGNNVCKSGKSYQCGKTCISNRWNCRKGVKDVNDARRIASILASTNEGLKTKASGEVSEKANARGKALFEARGNREANPKSIKVSPKPDTFYADKRKSLADEISRLEQSHSLDKKADALLRKTKGQPKEERIKKLIALGIEGKQAEDIFAPANLSYPEMKEPVRGFVFTSKPTKIRKLKAELEKIKDK